MLSRRVFDALSVFFLRYHYNLYNILQFCFVAHKRNTYCIEGGVIICQLTFVRLIGFKT